MNRTRIFSFFFSLSYVFVLSLVFVHARRFRDLCLNWLAPRWSGIGWLAILARLCANDRMQNSITLLSPLCKNGRKTLLLHNTPDQISTPPFPPLSPTPLSLLFYTISLFTSPSDSLPLRSSPNSNPGADYSFVASLEKFLAQKPEFIHMSRAIANQSASRLLNEPLTSLELLTNGTNLLIYLPSVRGLRGRGEMAHGSPAISQAAQPLKIIFIFLFIQHSIDYWLWTNLIAPESGRLLKNVVSVNHQEEAGLFYISIFTTISFVLMEKQQCKALYREALKWVTDQPAWKRSKGRDHILPVHHPSYFKSVRRYMKTAIWLLPDMDSTGNWYKPGQVSLEKDLILPYVPNVHLCDPKCLSESKANRKTLLFSRGRLKRNAGGKIRSKLGAELSGAEGVQIEEGTVGEAGKEVAQDGMRKSIFCLSPAGNTPSSARLFDAIVSGCIPVIVSDELELPFEGILHYRKIALFVSSSDAVQPGWLLTFLRSISPSQIREMRTNLAKYARHFLYSILLNLWVLKIWFGEWAIANYGYFGAAPDASDVANSRICHDDFLILFSFGNLTATQPNANVIILSESTMAGKLVNIKLQLLHTRRSQRVVKESRSLCTCDCRRANLTSPGSSS
ncbi:hypothetical protein RHSIM_Rhsim07G0247900 [Rhododendron simsii]|uniref:Exostosin GT47 domain-containing protein n=1 Tax=Rhododendron simsii TaxID=118357 RepID=A0A834LIM9_RHOSS|nr:hypothetical protein RHSIM_Rhsim07G0247900 [Rhododendron simsii]